MANVSSCVGWSSLSDTMNYEVCAAYAEAERDGQVKRTKNAAGKSPDEYAAALWRDAEQKGWL